MVIIWIQRQVLVTLEQVVGYAMQRIHFYQLIAYCRTIYNRSRFRRRVEFLVVSTSFIIIIY